MWRALALLVFLCVTMSNSSGGTSHTEATKESRTRKALLLLGNSEEKPTAQFNPWGKGISLGWPCKANNRDKRLLWMVALRIGEVECNKPYDPDLRTGKVHILTEPRLAEGGKNFLYPYAQDAMCVAVKKSSPERQNIAMTFSGNIWMLLGVSLVSFALLQQLVGIKGIPLETLRTFLMGSFSAAPKQPVANSVSLLLSSFGLIIISTFCGKFMSYLAVHVDGYQPQTLEDANSRVSVLATSMSKAMYTPHFPNESFFPIMLKKVKFLNWENYMRAVPRSSTLGILITRDGFQRYRRHPWWVDPATGESLTHMVPECLVNTLLLVFNVLEGWPLKARFDALMQRALEAGFFFKMETDQWLEDRQNGNIIPDVWISRDPKPMPLLNILEPLVLLGAGVALAFAAFVGEIIANRWRQKREGKIKL